MNLTSSLSVKPSGIKTLRTWRREDLLALIPKKPQLQLTPNENLICELLDRIQERLNKLEKGKPEL